MQSHADFWEVTRDALDFACGAFGVFDEELKQALLETYLRLDCYPEVKDVLLQLKQRGFRCAILSNGSPAMLAAAVQGASLVGLFERVISVEEAGTYKPSPSVYQLAVEQLTVPRKELCFLSANAWDAAGAARFGLRVVWVNRFRQHGIGIIPGNGILG
jgi:2-haloacid dehalogenase